jgi:hypothetical protein
MSTSRRATALSNPNDDTVAALAAICGFYNDDHNTQAAEISEYPAAPANGAPGNREP